MTPRARLIASLRGEPVDRTPVCFYELNGLDEDPDDSDPFNIYSHPSWKPLLDLTRDRSDRIALRSVGMVDAPPDPTGALTTRTVETRGRSRLTTTVVRFAGQTLTTRSRRDADVNTVWTTEHLLKDLDDLRTWLDLPSAEGVGRPDIGPVIDAEARLGDAGIVAIDTPDPLCLVAPLFEMGDYTVIALTEPELFHRALRKRAEPLYAKTEAVARALPGRLWRIYGPEYASPPYLPPALFRDYVTEYVRPMVEAIERSGGIARVHSHGRVKQILPDILATGCRGLDPIEPPGQGDITLAEARAAVGEEFVLFGNLEVSDLENLSTEAFAEKVKTALREGPNRDGSAFVLMPASCPYGRVLPEQTLRNYETMVSLVEAG